jgi:hypothetical protein
LGQSSRASSALASPAGVLVYGDSRQTEGVREKAARIRNGLAVAGDQPAGIARHGHLAGLLVEAGELAQGLLDGYRKRVGHEAPEEVAKRAGELCLAFADALRWSFTADLSNEREVGPGFKEREPRPGQAAEPRVPPPWGGGGWGRGEARRGAGPLIEEAAAARLAELLALDLPGEIEVRVPEGYAFYALYPETYLAAAERWHHDLVAEAGGPLPPLVVLGIRSIGTSLAAAVAATLRSAAPGAPIDLLTVRPGGHPFARCLDLPAPAAARLLSSPGARYAIVDEGPGLSGSSFGSVADWLEARGVPARSIAFFPSHGAPPGPQASASHRARWSRARRYTADFDDLFLADPSSPRHLARWAEDLTGPALGPLADLGAGRWRERHFPAADRWPAVHPQTERRKVLLTSASGPWLLKFAGLGRYGEESLARAELLQQAGLIPPVAGLRHGFLVGPWLEDARPLPLVPGLDREALVEGVARHLAFVATHFPVPPGRAGASPTQLLEMVEHNAAQALSSLGAGAAEPLRAWRESLPELTARVRPVLTDNRLHAWEWLLAPDGRILKADALDHHRGNDLIGPQDPAWDLAGASVELDLAEPEPAALLERFAAHARRPPPTGRQLAFYTAAYLAFELGRLHLAAESVAASEPAEAARLRQAADRHRARLLQVLHRREVASPIR